MTDSDVRHTQIEALYEQLLAVCQGHPPDIVIAALGDLLGSLVVDSAADRESVEVFAQLFQEELMRAWTAGREEEHAPQLDEPVN